MNWESSNYEVLQLLICESIIYSSQFTVLQLVGNTTNIFFKSSRIRNFQEILNMKLQISEDSELGSRELGGFTVGT